MSFSGVGDIRAEETNPGVVYKGASTILAANKYTDGLVIGRFARIASDGDLEVLDGSANPLIAGVVLRDLRGTLDADTYSKPLTQTVDYARQGLVTVAAVAGQTADLFDAIRVDNTAGADIGKARSDATGVLANAEFIKVVATNVWLIRLK